MSKVMCITRLDEGLRTRLDEGLRTRLDEGLKTRLLYVENSHEKPETRLL